MTLLQNTAETNDCRTIGNVILESKQAANYFSFLMRITECITYEQRLGNNTPYITHIKMTHILPHLSSVSVLGCFFPKQEVSVYISALQITCEACKMQQSSLSYKLIQDQTLNRRKAGVGHYITCTCLLPELQEMKSVKGDTWCIDFTEISLCLLTYM